MDNLLEKNITTKNIILYRGIQSIGDLFLNKKRNRWEKPNIIDLVFLKNKTIVEKSYLSTTKSINIGKGWAGLKQDQGAYMVLHIPKGIHYINREKVLNKKSVENEIILERGLKLLINNIEIDENNLIKITVIVSK